MSGIIFAWWRKNKHTINRAIQGVRSSRPKIVIPMYLDYVGFIKVGYNFQTQTISIDGIEVETYWPSIPLLQE